MSAEHAIKVFGETDQQVAGANGAIKMNPVMHGGRRRKTNKTRGGRKNKSRGGRKNKSNKNRKTMRGGK